MEKALILNNKGKSLIKRLNELFSLLDEFDCFDNFKGYEVESELYNTASILRNIQEDNLTKEDVMAEFEYDEDMFNDYLSKYLKT